jgi:hypothetical protein
MRRLVTGACGPHFTDAAAFGAGKRAVRKQDRRKVTTAVIVGACGKAGAALRELTLRQTHKVLSLLPALAAAHPLLRRVALVPKLWKGGVLLSYDLRHAWEAGVSSLLTAAAPVADLSVCARAPAVTTQTTTAPSSSCWLCRSWR